MPIDPGASLLSSLQQLPRLSAFPSWLKGSQGVDDGRGNFKVRSAEDYSDAVASMGTLPLYAEKWGRL